MSTVVNFVNFVYFKICEFVYFLIAGNSNCKFGGKIQTYFTLTFFKKQSKVPLAIQVFQGETIVILLIQGDVFFDVCTFPVVRLVCLALYVDFQLVL